MHIDHLSLTNFRNYARLEVSLPANEPIVIYGDNAQGKTSLLEAIYYLATSKSPYTSSDRQLIHWRLEDAPMPFARLAAELEGGGRFNRLETTLLMDHSTGRLKKTLKQNGVDRRVMDIIGLLNVVLFVPQDLALIEGSPAERRRFMDVTLSQIDKAYYLALDKYDKIVPQRNALLKRIADRQAQPAELAYWDTQLAEAGSVVIAERQRFLRDLERAAQRAHHELTGNRETLTLQYQPSFAPTAEESGQLAFAVPGLDLHRELDPQAIATQFIEHLQRERLESIRRGVTLSGPHRDELRLLINERDAGVYGSRGQARTAVMSLKLAELQWMQERTGEWPLLLLDEVVAELDKSRRAYLLDRINGTCQTLMTTTELEIFTGDFRKRAQLWRIENGQIV